MSPAAAIGLLLAVSLAGNAYLFNALGDAREQAGRADAGRSTAVAAAQTCSNYVGTLWEDAKKRTAAGMPRIAAARTAADEANRSADAEVQRAPAVPGDACASAEAETREWLQKRKETRHGR